MEMWNTPHNILHTPLRSYNIKPGIHVQLDGE